MPKLKPSTLLARQEHILNAAEQCFARSGFHRTTMQDICKAAGISPGALYGHFDSKEALIEGLCQRDRAKLTADLVQLAEAPDLMAALAGLGQRYAVEEPLHKRVLHVEIGAESTRNAAVGETFRSVDRFVRSQFEQLFERARDEGRISPSIPPRTLADILCVIGDGLFWRRAVEPGFDVAAVIPALTLMLTGVINPSEPVEAAAPQSSGPHLSDAHATGTHA